MQTLREVEQFDYGTTGKQEAWRGGKTVLYRFVSHGRPTAKASLLICYALVNRSDMVDLQSDKSIVRNLLARGEDVYIIAGVIPIASSRLRTTLNYWTTCECVQKYGSTLLRPCLMDWIDSLQIAACLVEEPVPALASVQAQRLIRAASS